MKPNQDMKRPNKSPGVSRQIAGRRVTLLGGGRYDFTDLYHLILTLSWPQFFALVFCFYLAVNAIFAFVFLASPDSITNARPGSFADALFFSIETLATVGYGTANFAVTISGLDETIMQAVHARHDHTASDILLGHRFVDLFVTNPDGEPVVDLSRIHDVT